MSSSQFSVVSHWTHFTVRWFICVYVCGWLEFAGVENDGRNRRVEFARLTARRNCSVSYTRHCRIGTRMPWCVLHSSSSPVLSLLYSPPSLTKITCLLLTYVLTLCVNAVDHIVAPSPSNNTRITLNAAKMCIWICAWNNYVSYTLVCVQFIVCSMYVFSCSTPSFSSPANSNPANSVIPCVFCFLSTAYVLYYCNAVRWTWCGATEA